MVEEQVVLETVCDSQLDAMVAGWREIAVL